MHPSRATVATVTRIVSESITAAARELPRFEATDRVWVKVKACERLIRRGLGSAVWREGVVIQRLDDGRLHEVSVPGDPVGLIALAGPREIRFTPPWEPRRKRDRTL